MNDKYPWVIHDSNTCVGRLKKYGWWTKTAFSQQMSNPLKHVVSFSGYYKNRGSNPLTPTNFIRTDGRAGLLHLTWNQKNLNGFRGFESYSVRQLFIFFVNPFLRRIRSVFFWFLNFFFVSVVTFCHSNITYFFLLTFFYKTVLSHLCNSLLDNCAGPDSKSE